MSCALQGWINLIKNTENNLRNIINIYKSHFLFKYILKCNLFLWCKAEFSAAIIQQNMV